MFHSIADIIETYQQGEMVILMDDEQRENEGDLLAPASLIKPEHINFMATHARGLICLTLTSAECDKLNLPIMTGRGNNANSTNFTLSIEAARGVTTGISAQDRATTIQAAVNPQAKPEDIVTPGHVFPIRARDGGVLVRAGHTEAGCDLAMLAGMPSHCSVIVEIMNEDGTMARLPELQQFAHKHRIKLGSIADLIRYRLQHEQLIERVDRSDLSGQLADFQHYRFYDQVDDLYHHALVKGDVSQAQRVWTRVHVQNYMQDMFHLLSAESRQETGQRWQLPQVLEFMSQQTTGVVVVLSTKQPIKNQPEHDNRTFGKGSQILRLLGVSKIGVLGSQANYAGISGFGIEVGEFVTGPDG